MADLNLYCDEELSGMIQDEDEDHVRDQVFNNDIHDQETIDFTCREGTGFLYSPFVHDFGSQDVLADMTEAILLGEDYFDKLRRGGLIMQIRNAGLHYISEVELNMF